MRLCLARVGLAALVVLGLVTGLAAPPGSVYAQGNGVHCPDGSHPPCNGVIIPTNGGGGTNGATPCNCTPQQQQEAAQIVGATYAVLTYGIQGVIPAHVVFAILNGLQVQAQRLPPALQQTVFSQMRDILISALSVR